MGLLEEWMLAGYLEQFLTQRECCVGVRGMQTLSITERCF